MAIGVPKGEIMHSTIVSLRVYDEAHKLKVRMQDELLYLSGIYTYEAVSIALSNAFRKKGSKAIEYRDKPILEQNRELTKEDIKQMRLSFVRKLERMGKRFQEVKKNG